MYLRVETWRDHNDTFCVEGGMPVILVQILFLEHCENSPLMPCDSARVSFRT